MALNFRKFLDGIRIIPKTSLDALPEKGDLEVTNGDGKLNYYNGTSSSPVVTEAHSATLTNKTLDSAVLTGPTTLDVNSASDALRITQTGAGAALRVEDSTNPDSTPFIVDSAGNVGIGVTPNSGWAASWRALQINAACSIFSGAAHQGTYFARNLYYDGVDFRYLQSNSGNLLGLNSLPTGGLVYWGVASGTAGNVATLLERFKITEGGNVGIGVTSPTRRLEVGGTASANNNVIVVGTSTASANNSGLIIFRDDTATDRWAAGILQQTAATAFSIRDIVAGSERLRIDSAGNVGIGTSSLVAKLQIRDTGAAPKLVRLVGQNTFEMDISSLTTTNSTVGARYDFAVNSSNGEFSWSNTGGERLRIDSIGRVLVGTTNANSNILAEAKMAIVGVGQGQNTGLTMTGYSGTSSTAKPILAFQKSRATSDQSLTAVVSNDELGVISFRGADGTNFVGSSAILGEVDGAVTTGNVPGRLTFRTMSGGVLTERLRIDSNGNVGIGVTTPATTLDFNGTFAIRSSSNSQTGAVTVTAPTTGLVRLTGAITAVRGVAGGVNGERVTLLNKSGSTVAINHEDSSATAADRILVGGGASFNLLNNASVELAYDSTASRWNVVGSASTSTQVTSVSADTILTSLNDVVLVNASGAARTITLPTPTSGKIITVKKTDASANAVTISRSSTETIDGNNSVSLAAQYDSYTMVSDGTNWFII